MRRTVMLVCLVVLLAGTAGARKSPSEEWKRALAELQAKLERLDAQVQAQSEQLREQGALIERQRAKIELLRLAVAQPPAASQGALLAASDESPAPGPAATQQLLVKKDDGSEQLGALQKGLAGFRFSGDFRYRFDIQARSGNAFAGPVQNIRSRYRLRFNVDKELDRRLSFHMQLSTAPLNNAITNDQDMGATVAKHQFAIAEAYVDFHPTPRLAIRGGRMEEIFADNMRFLWDDDIRFNGFHQIVSLPLEHGFLGFHNLELRGAEYFLSNPNVPVLAANSPFVSAGFQPGKKVRDAMLFHPGLVLKGEWNTRWRHQIVGDVQLYRNPNQIQLASTAGGVPVVVNNALGITLSGPMAGLGNATTTPGGAIYSARHFQVVRAAYRIERKGWRVGNREMPAWLDFQASRNVGAGRLRDAVMASANVGSVRGFGDVRFLYQFAIKDANALISQFTDDDLGTGSGVNIAVHALRFDLGLTRFLQWQNLLFLQEQRRSSNPAEQLFLPLQRGANRTYRYQGHLAFSF